MATTENWMKTARSTYVNCTDISSYKEAMYFSTETFCLHIVTLILGGVAMLANCFFIIIICKVPSLKKMTLSVYLINVSCANICLAVGYIIVVAFYLLFPDMNAVVFILLLLFLRCPCQVVCTILTVCIAWERCKGVCRPFQIITSPPHLARHCISIVAWSAMLFIVFAILNILWVTKGFFIFPISSLVTVIVIDVSTLTVTGYLYYAGMERLQEDPRLGQRSGVVKRQQQRLLVTGVLIDTTVYFILVVLLNFILLVTLTLCLKWELFQLIFEIQILCFLLHSTITPIINTTFGFEYRKVFFKMCLSFKGCRCREKVAQPKKAGNQPESTV